MRLLLDTHILVWMFADDPRLSQAARGLILDDGNLLYCSVASAWEMELKHAKRPDWYIDAKRFMGYCEQAQVQLVPITGDHVSAIASLPDVHKDPFDRLILGQARVEGMRLMTHDQRIQAYGLPFVIGV